MKTKIEKHNALLAALDGRMSAKDREALEEMRRDLLDELRKDTQDADLEQWLDSPQLRDPMKNTVKVTETKAGTVQGMKVLLGFVPDADPPEEGSEGLYGSWMLVGYGRHCPDELPDAPVKYGPFVKGV